MVWDIKESSVTLSNWPKEPYIEDIQVFGVNMSFISLIEVKNIYISGVPKARMKYIIFHFT